MEKNKEYLRCLMLFYFRKNKTATETKRKICAVYGNDAVSERVVQIWFSKFRKGDTSCVDGQRTGRPGVADCDKVKMLIERNPRFTTKKIADIINMSEKTVADYLQRLGYVVDGDGWRFDDSAPNHSDNDNDSNNNDSNSNSNNDNHHDSNSNNDNNNDINSNNNTLTDEEISAAEEDIFGYCNKEFAYEPPSLNCNVQITPTEVHNSTPRPPSVSLEDFLYIEDDKYYYDMDAKGKENNDSIGNTGSNTLPSFSEYFSNIYTSCLRGGGNDYCAIENININSMDAFNNSYPLEGYE